MSRLELFLFLRRRVGGNGLRHQDSDRCEPDGASVHGERVHFGLQCDVRLAHDVQWARALSRSEQRVRMHPRVERNQLFGQGNLWVLRRGRVRRRLQGRVPLAADLQRARTLPRAGRLVRVPARLDRRQLLRALRHVRPAELQGGVCGLRRKRVRVPGGEGCERGGLLQLLSLEHDLQRARALPRMGRDLRVPARVGALLSCFQRRTDHLLHP